MVGANAKAYYKKDRELQRESANIKRLEVIKGSQSYRAIAVSKINPVTLVAMIIMLAVILSCGYIMLSRFEQISRNQKTIGQLDNEIKTIVASEKKIMAVIALKGETIRFEENIYNLIRPAEERIIKVDLFNNQNYIMNDKK